MKYETSAIILTLLGLTIAAPVSRELRAREVPQEQSHNNVTGDVRTSLFQNNPNQIKDPIFALLGNAAAAEGQGLITDTDCLQQAVADQAFTNAKAAGDLNGMVTALIFRTLERNSGTVGGTTNACTETAVNPEIQALSQHQDPASTNAATVNKEIALELAKQIFQIGGDPTLAITSGTFKPGQIGDPTGAGNTCDDANDQIGCIYTQGLLVPDVTPDEIASAVAGLTAGTPAAGSAADTAASDATATATAAAVAATDAAGSSSCAASTPVAAAAPAASSASASAASSSTSGNLQIFTGTLGGPPPPVTSQAGDRPFVVEGNSFVNVGAALQRSCAIQHNACGTAANSGQLPGGVGQCDKQETDCNNADAGVTAKRAAAFDFGSCGAPTILFEESGLPDRQGPGFIAQDQTDYPHGSALNIAVIASFNCQQLSDKCKASADTVTACDNGASAAEKLTGQAAADAFNGALGLGGASAASTDATGTADASAASSSASSTAATSSSSSGDCAGASSAAEAPAASSAAAAAPAVSSAASSSTSASTSGNLQPFTGALGGIAATPVTDNGTDRQFSVGDDTFLNLSAALQRSCDQQKNACANAANSGKLAGGEQQCEQQHSDCIAAGSG